MSGLVHEHGRLEPYSLLSPEPMEADECVGDVVGVTQAVDEPRCHVRHRLKTPEQVGRKPGQDGISVVQPRQYQRDIDVIAIPLSITAW